jgi:hypothetical protein
MSPSTGIAPASALRSPRRSPCGHGRQGPMSPCAGAASTRIARRRHRRQSHRRAIPTDLDAGATSACSVRVRKDQGTADDQVHWRVRCTGRGPGSYGDAIGVPLRVHSVLTSPWDGRTVRAQAASEAASRSLLASAHRGGGGNGMDLFDLAIYLLVATSLVALYGRIIVQGAEDHEQVGRQLGRRRWR